MRANAKGSACISSIFRLVTHVRSVHSNDSTYMLNEAGLWGSVFRCNSELVTNIANTSAILLVLPKSQAALFAAVFPPFPNSSAITHQRLRSHSVRTLADRSRRRPQFSSQKLVEMAVLTSPSLVDRMVSIWNCAIRLVLQILRT